MVCVCVCSTFLLVMFTDAHGETLFSWDEKSSNKGTLKLELPRQEVEDPNLENSPTHMNS